MDSYVDIVAIKTNMGQMVMRTAPALSYLKPGNEVLFRISREADADEWSGTVVSSATFALNGDEYALLKASYGEDITAPVTYKVTYTPLFETEDRDLAGGE